MTFRPSVLPQRDDTFERAFQRGYNLVLGGQEQQRAQQEHEARMTEFAERAEQRVYDREQADLDRQLKLADIGARPIPEGSTPADMTLARALKEGGVSDRISEPRFGMQPQPQGAVQMPGIPEAGIEPTTGPQPEAQGREVTWESRAIIPEGTPAMPDDVQILESGDQRYAFSNLMNQRLAQERSDEAEARISPDEAALITAYRADNAERTEGQPDEVVLAQIALDQYSERYDRAGPRERGPDNVAARQRAARVLEQVDTEMFSRFGFEGPPEDPEDLERYNELRRRITQRVEDTMTAVEAETGPEDLATMSEDALAAGSHAVDEDQMEKWWARVLDDTGEAPSIRDEVLAATANNEGAIRLIRTYFISRAAEVWERLDWADAGNRPGRGGFNWQKNIFDDANTPEQFADAILGR